MEHVQRLAGMLERNSIAERFHRPAQISSDSRSSDILPRERIYYTSSETLKLNVRINQAGMLERNDSLGAKLGP